MADLIHPDDKKIFIDTLNKRGFILEKKAWSVLFNLRMEKSGVQDAIFGIERNVVQGRNVQPDNASEIDIVFHGMHYLMIIECKRTDFTWLFTKSENNVTNIISHGREGVKSWPRYVDFIPAVDSDIAIMIRNDGRLKVPNAQEKYAQTSYDEIYGHSVQLLKNLDSRLGLTTGNFPSDFKYKVFLPILLTNANLGIIEFSNLQIDDNGNLTNYDKLKQVPFVAYNKQFLMQFDDPSKNKDFTKSIFIVSMRNFRDFVEKFNDINLDILKPTNI